MKFYLRRVRINQGGYDDSGSYWGVGMPLYHYEAELPYTWGHKDLVVCETPEVLEGTETYTWPMCKNCNRSVYRHSNDVSDYIRAYDRDDAKARILAKYPDATFSR